MEKKILFVCTANVFRSKTAEFACRRALAQSSDSNMVFMSAGIRTEPAAAPWPYVNEYLDAIGLDTSGHKPRLLDAALLDEASLVVAMNHDHQVWIKDYFGIKSLLFTEVATGTAQPLPDTSELFALTDHDSAEARRHIAQTINRIVALSKPLIERLPFYMK